VRPTGAATVSLARSLGVIQVSWPARRRSPAASAAASVERIADALRGSASSGAEKHDARPCHRGQSIAPAREARDILTPV
jgi:hypothetical protein